MDSWTIHLVDALKKLIQPFVRWASSKKVVSALRPVIHNSLQMMQPEPVKGVFLAAWFALTQTIASNATLARS